MPPKPGEGMNKPEGPSDEERKIESARAAQQSLEAHKRVRELKEAAAGAGDPEERQRILNEAIEKEIEAERFGKTAKYMQTGTFQGMACGAGIGIGTGAGLGTLTGLLVGTPTSIILGGLGAGLGTTIGAAHGPFFRLGDLAGGAIRKVTGDLPGWDATPEQKKALEEMMGQVEETDAPSADELTQLSHLGGMGGDVTDNRKSNARSWGEYGNAAWTVAKEGAMSYVPEWPKGKPAPKPPGKQTPAASNGKPQTRSSQKPAGQPQQASGEAKRPQRQAPKKLSSGGAKKTPTKAPSKPAAAESTPKAAEQTQEKPKPPSAQKTPAKSTPASKTSASKQGPTQAKPTPAKQNTSRKASTGSTSQKPGDGAPERKKPRKLQMRGAAK